jgi:hypothetical protein
MWSTPDRDLRGRKEIDMNTFHIHDTILHGSGLHGPGRVDRLRRDAEMHRLLKGGGSARRPTIGHRLARAIGRR